MALDVNQVRQMLAGNPSLLQKGLDLYADGDGDPMGVDFPTPLGGIDVLCRDRKGGYVLIQVPKPAEMADSVSGMLGRMGWVRKHLASGGEDVRGVIVVEQVPEALAYAAAGAGPAIAFKGFRFALTFHDLEV